MKTTPARLLFRFVALLTLCLLPSLVTAQVPQFDAFYVFGDSLADNGNVLLQTRAMGMKPPVPPSATPHRTYFNGRFSNGYIGFEYLWHRLAGHQPGSPLGLKPSLAAPFILGPGALDFAFGGTGTPFADQTPGGFWSPGLKGQVELFRLALLGRKPSSRALYAVATGANDYRADPFNVPMSPAAVVRNIEEAIVSLYKLGARNVIVLDLPDLALIPANGGDPNATKISQAHNALLDSMLTSLQARYPSLHLIPVKLDPLFNELRLRMEPNIPALAWFTPPQLATCLFVNPASCTDAPAELFNANLRFLFWDVVHPTTEAHQALAKYMYDKVVNEYQ